MKEFLIYTVSSSPEYYGDCDFAYVKVDPTLAGTILKRAKVFKKAKEVDKDLNEQSYWDLNCSYFSFSDYQLSKVQEGTLDDIGYFQFLEKSDIEPDMSSCRPEGGCMAISETGVYWTCIPKHSDIVISTRELPFNLLEDILGIKV